MASDNGKSFPFTALSILALFVSTALLGPQAFELWRPSDSESRKRASLSKPPVEARLWEDPFAALARFRDRVAAACASESLKQECEDRFGLAEKQLREELEDKLHDLGPDGHLTVLAVLAHGETLAGTAEARRRLRHAVLAGLHSQGFIPEDSGRMGLLQARMCDRLAGCPESIDRSNIVFEMLHTDRSVSRPGRAVVLWIDDNKYRVRWLSSLTVLLGKIAPPNARIRIVGPTTSDSLAAALRSDAALWPKEAGEARKSEEARTGFQTNLDVLAKLQVISPFASAPFTHSDIDGRELDLLYRDPEEGRACERDCVGVALAWHVRDAAASLKGAPAASQKPPEFVRTISQDSMLAKMLVDELVNRGVDVCRRGRIVLISEWESVYARRFGRALQAEILRYRPVVDNGMNGGPRRQACTTAAKSDTQVDELVPIFYSYARGLDGATADLSAEQARIVARSSDVEKDKKKRPVEWPEGQAQEDYVRRLVNWISRQDRNSPVLAVGLIGNDLHDKLILAQALRETFSDRVLFTTDLDARLIHPTTTRWTRNMIVASGQPLDPESVVLHDKLSLPDVGALCDRLSQADVRDFCHKLSQPDVHALRDALSQADVPAQCEKLGRADVRALCHELSRIEVRDRFGPFRDSYQTAAFAAARLAPVDDVRSAKDLEKAIQQPVLLEIGRKEAQPLEGRERETSDGAARRVTALVGLLALAALAWIILWISPGPAMLTARHLRLGNPVNGEPVTFQPSMVFVVALEWAALGYAVGVLVDLGWPHLASPLLPPVLAGCAALLVPTFLFPETGWISEPDEGQSSGVWGGYRLGGRMALFLVALPLALAVLWALALPVDYRRIEEPIDPLIGTAAWPSMLILTLMIVLVPWFLDRAWFRSANNLRELTTRFFETDEESPRMFWSPNAAIIDDDTIDGKKIWQAYRGTMHGRTRARRVGLWFGLSLSGLILVVLATSYVVDRPVVPEIPAREEVLRDIIWQAQWLVGAGLLVLLMLAVDETLITWRFVTALRERRTVYPDWTVKMFANELGSEMAGLATQKIAANQSRRIVDDKRPGESPKLAPGKNSILDNWIDARLLADHTEFSGSLILYPFVLVGLAIVARSPITDNWDMGPGVLALVGVYLVGAIASAMLLNKAAERARTQALLYMVRDLAWLEGTNQFKALAPAFKDLIERVKNLRRGAFAPFFQRPWVQAVLVPLGGAGGVQLLEFLLYARPQ